MSAFYDHKVTAPNGDEVSMKDFEGKVVMVVNTATGCGFTKQYKDIEEMYEKYHEKGFEIVDVQLPVLVTVIETANDPRPFAARKVMRFKHAAVPAEVTPEKAEELKAKGLLMEQWTLDDVNADLNRCGMAGSPTKVFRIESIVLTKEGFVQIAPTEEGVTGLVQELIADRTL